MIKACWNCIAGGPVREEDLSWHETYQINNMFALPKSPVIGNIITVEGRLKSQREQLTVGLVTGQNSPDTSNVACQVEVNFPNKSNPDDRTFIKIINNGTEEILNESPLTGFFGGEEFTITFTIRDNKVINISAETFLYQLEMHHELEEIKFLGVSGDVEKVKSLHFEF